MEYQDKDTVIVATDDIFKIDKTGEGSIDSSIEVWCAQQLRCVCIGMHGISRLTPAQASRLADELRRLADRAEGK